MQQTECFCHFGPFFALLPPTLYTYGQNTKKKKKEKNTWQYYHFTNVYHKWQYHLFIELYQKLWSDDVQFLRYGAWQMQLLFLILSNFCPFTPLKPKISKFRKSEKSTWRYPHFTYAYQKLCSDDVRFLRYGAWRV